MLHSGACTLPALLATVRLRTASCAARRSQAELSSPHGESCWPQARGSDGALPPPAPGCADQAAPESRYAGGTPGPAVPVPAPAASAGLGPDFPPFQSRPAGRPSRYPRRPRRARREGRRGAPARGRGPRGRGALGLRRGDAAPRGCGRGKHPLGPRSRGTGGAAGEERELASGSDSRTPS